MQNDKETRFKDTSNPTRWQYFWRVQKECWRRMITPYLMYLFMSLLLLSLQAIVPDENNVAEIVLGILCIFGAVFFNVHLMYHTGVFHFDNFLTGEIHRRNAMLGIPSGGDHRPEREYRAWKGFYIGFLVSLPVLILGLLSHFFYEYASLFFGMFAGWAIIPIAWFGTKGEGGGLIVDPIWSILFAIIPILVSGISYIVGALIEKRRKENEKERDERVQKAGKRK